jgi:hypothetical protein
MRRVVGILVGPKVFKRIKGKRTGHEHISLYNRAARKLDLTPFYMTLPQVRAQSVSGLLYENGNYRREVRSIPAVTHNRTFAGTPALRNRMTMLKRHSKVFNQENRFSKYRINKLLSGSKRLRSHVPMTVRYSKENLIQAMKKHQGLFVKPVNNSVGIGIMKLTKVSAKKSGGWSVQWAKNQSKRLSPAGVTAAVNHRISGRSYIIQDTIPLALYKGRPYDLRVSVQRSSNGNWQVTGIVGKVAPSGGHVTNVARGGKVVKCETLLRSSGFHVEARKQAIRRVSLGIVQYLGKRLPHLADVGLDIGVDRKGHVKFIEMNGRDQRYAFKKAGMSSSFYKSYETPLKYAKYLLRKKK